MSCRRRSSVLVAVSVALAGLTVATPAPALALAPPVSTPCELNVPYPAGDAGEILPIYGNQIPPEPDLDITNTDTRITATDVITTITVTKLGDRPIAATGDQFYVGARLRDLSAAFGYVRDTTGGHPQSYDPGHNSSDLPAPVTSSARVVPFYDRANSQVTLTISRAELARAFGVPQHDLLLYLGGADTSWSLGKELYYGSGDNGEVAFPPMSVADCDAYLASHPAAAAPDPGPCGLSFDAPVGDEAAAGVGPETITDDDTDITHVDVTSDASTVTVTEQVARLAAGPIVGSGHRFGVAVSQGGQTAHIGADQEAAAVTPYVTRADGTAGSSSLTATFDTALSRFQMRVPRADWDGLFGGAGAAGTVDHLSGESSITSAAATVRASDTGAVAPGDGRFSVADCDATLSAPAPTAAPTTVPPIAAPAPVEVPIGTAPTTAPPTTAAPSPTDSPTTAPSPAPSTTAPPAAPSPAPASPAPSSVAPHTQAASSAARVTSVRPGAGTLSVAFGPASGSGISGYVASCTLQGTHTTTTGTGTRSPITVKGLQARRTYVCSVRPKTSRGLGAASNSQTGRPGAVPKVTLTAPRKAGSGQAITLTGTASASGLPVTGRSVVITFRKAGSSTRTMIGLTKTDAKGRYAITLANPGPGAYQATVLIESLVTRNREVYVHAR